jgi:hypothetical protein
VAGPQGDPACDSEPDKAAISACNAERTGDIRFCEGIEDFNDVLYCFAMARKSTDGCSQITDAGYRDRCMKKLGF